VSSVGTDTFTQGGRVGAPSMSAQTAGIAAIGRALPEQEVSSESIAERLGVDEHWILSRTGVRSRRHAREGERLVELAAGAGRAALERARFSPADLDLVLVASFTQDELLPNAAPQVAAQLGAVRAGAIDLGAACTGFVSGLALASAQIESRRATAVLVVGADLLSRVTDNEDRGTAALFGDGAGAALVTAGGPGRVGPILQRSDGAGGSCMTMSHSERKMRMRGQDTFRAAVARMSEVTLEALEATGLGLDEIDLFVYHQANTRIIDAVGERLGLREQRVIDCIERYGNTAAASVPIALREAELSGRLNAGDTVLVAAFGAGWVWGAGIVEWGTCR
jgi:3-oxoacyl-[acyl-carrier-protein] synthase-3